MLEGLALPDLEATRVSPRDGRTFTVVWCLAHALEHTALHLGHIQVTRQLWDQGKNVSPQQVGGYGRGSFYAIEPPPL